VEQIVIHVVLPVENQEEIERYLGQAIVLSVVVRDIGQEIVPVQQIVEKELVEILITQSRLRIEDPNGLMLERIDIILIKNMPENIVICAIDVPYHQAGIVGYLQGVAMHLRRDTPCHLG